ncbi:BatD family protein [bacterium]|nr:BatD family protein [bacterium]MBU1983925.1 BatD family protein [bacterium]
MIGRIGLALTLLCVAAYAQERFTATVDRTTLRVGESLQLMLVFEGAASGVSAPAMPPLENLQVAGGPFTSSSTSIVNGRVSSSASFTYVLRATREGPARIGGAQLIYKRKSYSSNPITLTVLPSTGGSVSSTDQTQETNDVFLRVYPDKREVYLGEQITVQYKIFFGVQISNPEFVQMPRATGFWMEDFPLPKELPLSDELVNGRSYRTAVIRKTALFPTTVGDLEVEPFVISTKVQAPTRRRSRDPFDIFNDPFFQMGRQMVAVEVASPGFSVRVKSLPETGVPAGFNGAVGQFRVIASLDRASCQTNEGVTLTVNIEGEGNVKMLPEPVISFPPDIQYFDPEISDDVQRGRNRIQGRKSFRYVIIPRAPGVQTIPAWSYPYFDPQRQQYLTSDVAELRLNVERGTASSLQPTVPVASKHGVKNIATDIAFVKTQPGTFSSYQQYEPHTAVGFWLGMCFPWMALACAAAAARAREKRRGPLLERLRAQRQAVHELSRADRMVKLGRVEQALRNLAAAADQALFAATGISVRNSTTEEIREHWEAAGSDGELLNRLLSIREQCDLVRFGTATGSAERCRKLIADARDVITALGRFSTAGGKRS